MIHMCTFVRNGNGNGGKLGKEIALNAHKTSKKVLKNESKMKANFR